MQTDDFTELSGRIEGLARAVLVLAWTMERETDMDGLTLTRHWRESVGEQPGDGSLRSARTTLHELAQALDAERIRHQGLVLAQRLAEPSRRD